MSFEIGQIVGGYEIAGVVGAGGMGTVYRVRNPITDRVDAMKVLLPDLSDSPDLAGRFSREIKIHASLRHPNIAALYTAMQLDNQLLMVMEFVEGITLEQRLRYGTLGIGEAMDYMHQILSALGYAHQHGVVHRDIKPSNIMITAEGRVKLLDFGIARGPSDMRITNTGMVIGSLLYMAPEQVLGGTVDERSDVYSAGVTLYQMVTGRTPVEGTNEFSIMRAQAESIPAPPCAITGAVEPELSRVIMKSLEKNPMERFQNANQFSSALDAFRLGVHRTQSAVPAAPTPLPALPKVQAWDPAVLDQIRRALAAAIGPMAKVLVERTSKRADSVKELCQLLSQEIPSAKEREAFLSQTFPAGPNQ